MEKNVAVSEVEIYRKKIVKQIYRIHNVWILKQVYMMIENITK